MEHDLEDELYLNAPDGGEDEPPTATTAEPRPSTSGYRPPPMFAPGPSTLEIPSPSRSSPSKPRAIMPTSSARVTVPQWQDEDAQRQAGLHMRDDDDDEEDEEEGTAPRAPSDPANMPLASTSTTAAVNECPLCTRPFTDNDELNAHIDWCLSRGAIRSAQVESDRGERRKADVGVQHLKEWWKGGSAESTATSRKPKRRRKLGG
jgi:DNA polymerase kappa